MRMVNDEIEEVNRMSDKDTIYRQDAIDAADKIIARDTSGNNDVVKAMTAWKEVIKGLPSAEPKLEQITPSEQGESDKLGVKSGKTCTDTISRQDAIDATWFEPSYTDPLNVLTEARDRIEALPSAEPERKKGKWIDKSGGIDGAWNYCSVCGEQAIDLFDFCPNCGADMRGK